jgi:hypothetical protein
MVAKRKMRSAAERLNVKRKNVRERKPVGQPGTSVMMVKLVIATVNDRDLRSAEDRLMRKTAMHVAAAHLRVNTRNGSLVRRTMTKLNDRKKEKGIG